MVMAKRSYSKKGRKIEPAVQTFVFATPDTVGGAYTIDLSQVASIMNRRFYRQGINWVVSSFKFSSLKTGALSIGKLPNTWVMSNAWEKGFRAWQRMNREAMEEAPSVRPKFLDFKVYADDVHYQSGVANNLMPTSLSGGNATPGEWVPSKIVYPTSTGAATPGIAAEMELVAVGPNFPGGGASGLNAVSLIEGYAASRGLPNIADPNTPDDADSASGTFPQNWISAMFNDGTEQTADVLDDLINDNNIAPYPFENDGTNIDTMYPGGANQLTGLEYHGFANIIAYSAGQVGTQVVKGGNFPCGLVRVNWDPAEAANLVIEVNLVPGDHRGYFCEPMTEM